MAHGENAMFSRNFLTKRWKIGQWGLPVNRWSKRWYHRAMRQGAKRELLKQLDEEVDIMDTFNEWKPAHDHAILKATQLNMDHAIRQVKHYGKTMFVVTIASRNDSDYDRAEIVTPIPVCYG